MKRALRKAIEKCGWNINSDTSIEMWTDTAGQDVFIECNKPEELVDAIKNRYENYDIDEEVKLYLEAKNNGFQGVPSATILVKDCEEVAKKLEELYFAVCEVA